MRLRALGFVLLVGCAHVRPVAVARVQMEPIRFEADSSGHVHLMDASALFARAESAYLAKRFGEAARLYDQVAAGFPGSSYEPAALYNAGLALEKVNDLRDAAARYRQLATEHAGAIDGLDALFRLSDVLGRLESWPRVRAVCSEILKRADLTLGDRLEAMTRGGVAQYEMHEYLASEHALRAELRVYHAAASTELLDSNYFVAMAAYYLGEIAHAEYRALPIRMPEKRLLNDLEAKGRMLLVAQQRYLDTVRLDNVQWATAAGFQIGSLYRELYDDLINAPLPAGLASDAQVVYRQEVRRQVSNLLRKAIHIHEQNLLMAERNGLSNTWVERSRRQLAELQRLLEQGAPPAPPARSPLRPAPLPRPRDEVRPRVIL